VNVRCAHPSYLVRQTEIYNFEYKSTLQKQAP
jgi:hypothetical protein